jgi:hypothetical protein
VDESVLLFILRLPPFNVVALSVANVTVAPVFIGWGRLNVTEPEDALTLTWFVVPATDVTPVLVREMLPAPFVMLRPLPAVRVDCAYPEPFPIKSWPFAGVVVTPVPPRATARVPLAMLPALSEVMAEPSPESEPALKPPDRLAEVPDSAPVRVSPANVGVLLLAIACGRLIVTPPMDADTIT